MSFIEGPKSREQIEYLLEKVSFDHDGTIANSRQAVTDEFNFSHGTKHDAIDIHYWDAIIDWGLQVGLTRTEALAENERLWYEPETIYKAEPVAGAVELLKELEKRKHAYIINSSRRPKLHESTVEWYKEKIPFVPESRIHTGLSDMADGLMSKIWRIQQGRLRLHLEDVPEQAYAILTYTDAHVILLSNSCVLDGHEPGRLTVVHGERGKMPDLRAVNDFLFS